MALPSLSAVELQVLIFAVGVLIFFGSFLALVFSAVFALGLARLLYVGGSWCVRKIHSHTVAGALPIVPYHSH
jgi:hypothetical protein